MSSPPLLVPGLDLSFLSAAYDGARNQPSQQPVEKKETSSAGKVKKVRNRKHQSCEPCRQRKVKCDRQSTCANCRLHHKRCYYVDAKPVANSAEDELVAAREEIDRLRALVKLLMQGAAKNGGGNDLSSPAYTSASSASYGSSEGDRDFPVLPSPSFSSPYNLPTQASLLLPLPYSSSPPTLSLPPISPTALSYTVELSAAYSLPPPPFLPTKVPLPPLPVVAGLPSFEPLPPEVDPVLFCG